MLSVLSIFGTRPEAIKMAPVVRELERHREAIWSVVCSTGQHQDMLHQVCDLFGMHPDIELNVMQPNQTLAGLTARLFDVLDPVVAELKPDWVLAQGDTTTVLVASLVAYYRHIPFGHVESGLRTGDPFRPFPEELNRITADAIARLLFAPTELSRETLLREGHPESRIVVTGNTVIDALHMAAAMPYEWEAGPLAAVPADRRLVLVTAHRRESFGQPFREMCMAVRDLAAHFAGDGVHFVYPVHPNPNVRRPVFDILSGAQNVTLLEPLDYLSLIQLMKRSTLVVTDSGGIQEEAPALGVPVLVTRETTERPEGVGAGVVKLVGTDRSVIVQEAKRLLMDVAAHDAMARCQDLYGDGKAAQRIVRALLEPLPQEERSEHSASAPVLGRYVGQAAEDEQCRIRATAQSQSSPAN